MSAAWGSRLALLLLLLSSCTSESDDPQPRADGGDVERPDDGGEPEAGAAAVGRFQITMVRAVAARGDQPESPAYTSMVGRVYDAEVPPNITWTATAEEGACTLLEPSIPACDPACSGTDVCVADGRCVAYPRSLDLGTVTLRGLMRQSGEGEIAIDPPPSKNYQLPGGVQLAYPPFAERDAITLDAEGGELPAFTIETTGIAELDPTIDGPLRFTAESATELRWAPAADAAASRILVRVDISHHGGQKGEIVCDAEDTGSLAIPAALGAQLIDLGIAGYPSLQITREAIGTANAGGARIELVVASPVTLELDIPGLVSCDEPGAQGVCPDGQQCQPDWRCQ
jgi:hypothetical protein